MANTYDEAISDETNMRACMYQPGFEDHPMNTDPYYDLKEITPEWFTCMYQRPRDPDLLFTAKTLTQQYYEDAKHFFSQWDWIFQTPGVFMAGGAVFSGIYNKPVNDIDLFIYGCSPTDAMAKLKEVYKSILSQHNFKDDNNSIDLKVMRSANAITIKVHDFNRRTHHEYQIILRLYRTPSEILHGFDVDSCSLGYDGKKLWMTPRCEFALRVGYNTVNFDRLSPSYEKRLAKYGTRGVAVKIPNFDKSKVNEQKLSWLLESFVNGFTTNPGKRYKTIYMHKGLDLLIYLDYHARHYNYHKGVIGAIANFADEASDYNPVVLTNRSRSNVYIGDVLEYLEKSAPNYPDASAVYMPLIREYYSAAGFKNYDKLKINSIPCCSNIYYIEYVNFNCRPPHKNSMDFVCDIPQALYDALGSVRPWKIQRKVEFKVTNPGEQMTNTFHSIVLQDNAIWYEGEFYQI